MLSVGKKQDGFLRGVNFLREYDTHVRSQWRRATALAEPPAKVDRRQLRGHLTLNVNDATVEQLADSNLATNEEIFAMLTAYPRYRDCQKRYLSQIAGYVPLPCSDLYRELQQDAG